MSLTITEEKIKRIIRNSGDDPRYDPPNATVAAGEIFNLIKLEFARLQQTNIEQAKDLAEGERLLFEKVTKAGKLELELEEVKNIYTKVGLEMQEINRKQSEEITILKAENARLNKYFNNLADLGAKIKRDWNLD